MDFNDFNETSGEAVRRFTNAYGDAVDIFFDLEAGQVEPTTTKEEATVVDELSSTDSSSDNSGDSSDSSSSDSSDDSSCSTVYCDESAVVPEDSASSKDEDDSDDDSDRGDDDSVIAGDDYKYNSSDYDVVSKSFVLDLVKRRKNQLSEIEQKLEDTETKLDKANANLKVCNAEQEKYKNKIVELELTLEDTEAELIESTCTVTQLFRKIDGMERRERRGVEQHKIKIGELEQTLEDTEAKLVESTSTVNELFRKIDVMEQRERRVEQHKLTGDLEKKKDNSISFWKRVAQQKDEAIIKLEEKVASMEQLPQHQQDEIIANKYRKLLKMGMPLGAVAQKMQIDEVDEKIIDTVITVDWKRLAQQKDETISKLKLEIQVANGRIKKLQDSAAAAEGWKRTAQQKDETIARLSNDLKVAKTEYLDKHQQGIIANKYKKMIKVGMPLGAVTLKMQVDAVDQKIVDAVVAEDWWKVSAQEKDEVIAKLENEIELAYMENLKRQEESQMKLHILKSKNEIQALLAKRLDRELKYYQNSSKRFEEKLRFSNNTVAVLNNQVAKIQRINEENAKVQEAKLLNLKHLKSELLFSKKTAAQLVASLVCIKQQKSQIDESMQSEVKTLRSKYQFSQNQLVVLNNHVAKLQKRNEEVEQSKRFKDLNSKLRFAQSKASLVEEQNVAQTLSHERIKELESKLADAEAKLRFSNSKVELLKTKFQNAKVELLSDNKVDILEAQVDVLKNNMADVIASALQKANSDMDKEDEDSDWDLIQEPQLLE